jgi:hypothetical protein
MLHSCTARLSLVRVSDKEILLPVFIQLHISNRLRNTKERCKDSLAIQAFSDDGKYLIKIALFILTVIAVGTKELEKVCSKVQPMIKSSCMVPPDMALDIIKVIRAIVPVVTGTSNLRTPLAMDFRWQMGLQHLTMRTMLIIGCKTRWRLKSSSWTRSIALLCRTSEGHMPLFA